MTGRIEDPRQSATSPVIRFESSERTPQESYDSPYLPSARWDELLSVRDGAFPLRLNFQRGFLVERTTGKFVNVGNRHLRSLGIWSVRIRGDSHHSGEAWPGRKVLLVREPDNAHDRNAIAILTEHGEKIGYWNKGTAASLAKVMDAGQSIEAVALSHAPPKVVAAAPEIMAQLQR